MDDTPGSALAVYAHPDDPEVACGGTLARWAAAGCRVEVVLCNQGDKGSADPAVDRQRLVRTRTEEARRAGELLGVSAHHHLGYEDGGLYDGRALTAAIVAVIRASRPEVVVCPDPTAVFFGSHYYNHRDHRAVGWAALDAVAPAASSPHYFPDAGAPHRVTTVLMSGTLEPDVWVDITGSIDAKARALQCHESQVGQPGEWLRDVVTRRAEEAGRHAGVRFAEGYRRLALG